MTIQCLEMNAKDARKIGSRADAPAETRTDTVRVLIVDDHLLVRIGLRTVISDDPRLSVCGEAANVAKAVEAYRVQKPDVVLMDLRLPDGSGVDATAAIRAEFPEARVIVVSSFAPDEEIHAAVQAGARAYVMKTIEANDLRAVIYAVMRGERHIPAEVAGRLATRNPQSDLTERERAVLQLVVRGKRNREIAETLDIAEGTVKGHVQTILLKLGVTDRTEAATVAIERGIVHLR
jgi:two-component system NarL family response regulator